MWEAGIGGIDWTAALQQHEPWLRRVLACRIGNRHEVDDLMQEIALAVVRQQSLPQDPVSVAPWLYRLAVRQAINFHRKMGRKSHPRPTEDLDCVSRDQEPLYKILQREQSKAMENAIRRLGMRDRQLLTLKYSENWSYRQLAEHLGVHMKTIEYRLMKARQRLRSLIVADVDPSELVGN
jgi:RNA polymerase sigma-70 factor (ECF subfamily)